MQRLVVKGNIKYLVALLIAGAVLAVLFFKPGDVLGLVITVDTDKPSGEFQNIDPATGLPEPVNLTGEVSLTSGELRQIDGAFFRLTGPRDMTFGTLMDGGQEAAPTASPAKGTGYFTLNRARTELEYHITVDAANLSGAISAAHFHHAAPGVAGPVVRDLAFTGGTASGVWTSADGQPLTPALVKDLLDGNIYVNVHTAANPAGEIRGQLVMDTEEPFQAALDGAQEVPATPSTAQGAAKLAFDDDTNTLTYWITYDTSLLLGAFTAAHIHTGALGVPGGVVHPLTFVDGTAAGAWVGMTDEQVALLRASGLYINVHSSVHSGGEIRGQIVPQGTMLFTADPVVVELPIPTAGVPVIANLDLSSELAEAGGLGQLMVNVSLTGLEVTQGPNGYSVAAGATGGLFRYNIEYTPPAGADSQGTYTAQLHLDGADGSDPDELPDETFDSPLLTFTVLGAPLAEALDTLYPMAGGQTAYGSEEAIGSDLVILQVSTDTPLSEIEEVRIDPSAFNPMTLRFIQRGMFHPALLAKWGVSADAEFILPVQAPADALPGLKSLSVKVVNGAGGMATANAAVDVVEKRSAFAVYLMPGLNFISTPLQSTDKLSGYAYDMDALLAQEVSAYVDPAFEAGLGHTATLADVVSAVFCFPGGSSSVPFDSFVPGLGGGPGCSAFAAGTGYIVSTNPAAFNSLTGSATIAQPVPAVFEGAALQITDPLQAPPVYPVVTAWNLVGPHTERNTFVDRFLSGANVPTRTWVSLYEFRNLVTARTTNGAVQGDPADALEHVTSQFRGRFTGRPSAPEGDVVSVGSGLWLFMAADDELTAVLDGE